VYLATDPAIALLWVRIAHIAVPLPPVAIYVYTSLALRQYQTLKILVWLVVLVALANVGLDLSGNYLVAGVEKHWCGCYTVYGPAGPFLAGFFGVVIVLSLTGLWAQLSETAKGTVFSRRIIACCFAGVATALAAIDFLAGFGADV
jgi:hypothetical protein